MTEDAQGTNPPSPDSCAPEREAGRLILGRKGYTFIEISVVIVLISVIFLLAVPTVRDTVTSDRMRSAVRHLSGTARELKSGAVREQVDHFMHLDLDRGLVWDTRSDMTAEVKTTRRKQARALPAGIKVTDVTLLEEGKKSQGEVIIRFFSQGYVHPAAIHLAQDDRVMTLVFQPFLSTFDVHEKYVDVWQKSK